MILAVVLGLAVFACDRPDPSIVAGARVIPDGDLLLITIDAWRADASGFGGREAIDRGAELTPGFDRLAAAGRVFDNARAHNVVTLPSHANLLTGLYPFQHGVRDNSGFVLSPEIPTLATLLRQSGYATAAFVGAFPLDSRFGLDSGFDVYDDAYPRAAAGTGWLDTLSLQTERRGDEVVAAAQEWWRKAAGRKRFLWLHLFDPHAPYAPPEPHASRFADRPYLGEVAAADAFLEPLLRPFLDGDEPPALVVMTSGHGEGLGDHGELTHGLFAYESTLRVPLVIWGTGWEPARDSRSVGHIDVLPTILEALGLTELIPAGLPGRSLLDSQWSESSPERTLYFEALSATLHQGWAPLRGIVRGSDKLIELPIPELYDLAVDPGETDNLFPGEDELGRRLATELPEESVWPPTVTHKATAEEARHLLGLGYLSGAALPKHDYGPEDDPKNLIELDRSIHRVMELLQQRRFEDATSLARQIVEERPAMALGHTLLARGLLEQGQAEAAIAVMERARALGAANTDLNRLLASTLNEAGRAEEVVEILGRWLSPESGPANLADLIILGVALIEVGRPEEARQVLERARRLDPEDPRTLEALARLQGLR